MLGPKVEGGVGGVTRGGEPAGYQQTDCSLVPLGLYLKEAVLHSTPSPSGWPYTPSYSMVSTLSPTVFLASYSAQASALAPADLGYLIAQPLMASWLCMGFGHPGRVSSKLPKHSCLWPHTTDTIWAVITVVDLGYIIAIATFPTSYLVYPSPVSSPRQCWP